MHVFSAGATMKSVVPVGYKQTEVGVIPEDWSIVRCSEITALIGKGASPKWQGFQYTDHGMLFVTSENVRDGFLDISEPKYLPLEFHEKLKRTKLQQGDILINLVGGSIGRSCRITRELGDANVNQAVAVFRLIDSKSGGFVSYLFHAPMTVKRIMDMQVDAARPNISLTNIRDFVIPLPPTKAEQEAIAEALSDTDALIESLEQLITKKRHLKQGAMQELLTGKKRLPGFSGEWEVKRLDAVCSMKSGEGITSDDIDEGAEFPCYGGNGLRGYAKSYTHDGNYALIGRQGALCGNVLGVSGKFFASEHAIVVTPFLQTEIVWLTFILGKMNLNQYSESSAQPGLSVSKLLDLSVDCPPTKAEQTAIANILSAMDAEITTRETKLAKTRQLKQGMMHNLLTGRIRLI